MLLLLLLVVDCIAARRPLPQRCRWQCMHRQRRVLVHPASMEEILEEEEHM